jgi:hypothetical protein
MKEAHAWQMPKFATALPEGALETLGALAGWILAPAVAVATRARGTRLIHAVGEVREIDVMPESSCPRSLARSLRGRGLARFSAALGREGGAEWPDVLGLALRLQGPRQSLRPQESDQDLLLVTATSAADLPAALFRTDPHDFLANTYCGMAAFEVAGLGRADLRVRWQASSPPGRDRFDRLSAAVQAAIAEGEIEARPSGGDRVAWPGARARRGAARAGPAAARFLAVPVGPRHRADRVDPRSASRAVPRGSARATRTAGPAKQRRRPCLTREPKTAATAGGWGATTTSGLVRRAARRLAGLRATASTEAPTNAAF